MLGSGKSAERGFEHRYIALLIVILAVAVFTITWFGIKESRSDSLQLLVLQGSAFVEALAESANNAIVSERFFDYLVHKRYSELVVDLGGLELNSINDQLLVDISLAHNLYGIFVYAADSSLVAGAVTAGPVVKPPDFVYDEITQIIADPEQNYLLLLDQGDSPDETVHYYVEITNRLDRVILIIADALYYVDALSQTQIGYLTQKMARETGVEYIIYQSTDGIIFSSKKTGRLLSIESDSFLTESLESDSIRHREYSFQDSKVLELVRPFATDTYPFGLLRVGLSLDHYRTVSRGYDVQMITLSAVLFSLVVVAMLYLGTRRRGKEMARQYRRIKSISDKIFEEMRTGVAAFDNRGVITLANDAFAGIMGQSDPVGIGWDELTVAPEMTFDSIRQGSDVSCELETETRVAGAMKSLLIAVSKMLNASGEFEGMVAVVYDITRLKELEQKSARRERLSEMGNLAAGVAHEIRNPLNAISIAAQRLAGEFTPSEGRDEYLAFTRQIKAETKRLNDIITRFLALAREQNERHQRINLSRLLDDFVGLIRFEADKLAITVKVDTEPDLHVAADPDGIKQVLSNLFNNSKEALGGQPGDIAISARALADRVQLRFADSGPGVADEIRDQVFTPYYTTKDAGTGLGLPTVHRIVSGLGGDISVEQSKLGGAEFVINLPR
ncbi:MAG: PAS domain S-box protein [Candidatus Zixiibacteriota bacterium]|nr:MAG: PAS domain S-box protein [candidate division Zixibacteria bacterium]